MNTIHELVTINDLYRFPVSPILLVTIQLQLLVSAFINGFCGIFSFFFYVYFYRRTFVLVVLMRHFFFFLIGTIRHKIYQI